MTMAETRFIAVGTSLVNLDQIVCLVEEEEGASLMLTNGEKLPVPQNVYPDVRNLLAGMTLKSSR